MTSRLAKAQIEKWWSEGLKPSFDDIVLLNNLGLTVERESEMFSFSALPRVAFLGDHILREPTVAKRIWIDVAQQLFADTLETKIYVMAYALGTSDDEMPDITNKKKIEAEVIKYRDEVLMKFTDTQILAAIDYVMNGTKPDLELPDDPTEDKQKKEKEELAAVYDGPSELHSVAKQLFLQAVTEGMDADVAKYAMLDDLDRMVMVAAMKEGKDMMKSEHTKNAGKFYVASGRIHERLLKER